MGWASGAALFESIWTTVRDRLPEECRVAVCRDLVFAFEQFDCDTLHEAMQDEWPELATALSLMKCSNCGEMVHSSESRCGYCDHKRES